MLVLIFGLVLIIPKYQSLMILQTRVANKEAEYAFKEEYVSRLKQINAKLGGYQEAVKKINHALASDPNLPSFLEFLQQTASQTGLLFVDAGSFNEVVPRGNVRLGEARLEIQVKGSYENLISFLSQLEKSARMIKIYNVRFSEPSEKDENFSFRILMAIPFWNPR